MKHYFVTRLSLLVITIISLASSCNRAGTGTKKVVDNGNPQNQPVISFIHLTNPKNGAVIKPSDIADIQVTLADTIVPDSIQFRIDGIRLGMIHNSKASLPLNASHEKVGTRTIQAIAFLKNKRRITDQIQVKLYPGKPVSYTYKVIKSYPHDKDAYTQGLIFDNGILYEGTGLTGKSSLRKETLNGEIINALTMPSDLFGEGITEFDGKIIQITWTSQVAFVYDKTTFKQLLKLNYPMKEGWGITYNGKNLIMSDGSATIFFLDKQDLSEVSQLEICDDRGPVTQLNELEYIDGQIWANIYQTDNIVRIDPQTGAVIGLIDLSGILKPGEKDAHTDVLNGIAYDSQTKKIFVTGKNWPKLFEISVSQKN